jgi:hypothetical protein
MAWINSFEELFRAGSGQLSGAIERDGELGLEQSHKHRVGPGNATHGVADNQYGDPDCVGGADSHGNHLWPDTFEFDAE